MADDQLIDQDEIERLLNQGASDDDAAPDPKPAAEDASSPPRAESEADSGSGEGEGEEKPQGAGATPPPAAQPAETPPAPSAGDDDNKLLGQQDIEKLLDQAGKTPAAPPPASPASPPAPPSVLPEEGTVSEADVDYLLGQAERALESINAAASDDLPEGMASFRLEELSGAPASTENATLELIRDVELDLKIELGRTHMYLEDVLKLRKGSVVPLDKLAGDPVDIYVNGRLIARGEVLVLSDNFCVRVAELIAGVSVST